MLFHDRGRGGVRLQAAEDVDRGTHVSIVRFWEVMIGKTLCGELGNPVVRGGWDRLQCCFMPMVKILRPGRHAGSLHRARGALQSRVLPRRCNPGQVMMKGTNFLRENPRYCGESEVYSINRTPEPQVLRLRLAQRTRQSPLRMTVNFDMNFRLRAPGMHLQF